MTERSIQEIQQQAADFVVCAFSGNVTEDDEQRLNDWLDADKRHLYEYQKMLQTWDEAGGLSEAQVAEMVRSAPVATASSRQLFAGAFAACVALVALVAVFSGTFRANDFAPDDTVKLVQHTTTVGEQRMVSLPDGSSVTLNTNSKLIVDFSDAARRLILDRGEGFFDVAKDKNRPFIVDVGGQYVTALGTKFSVRRDTHNLTVGVVEGVVAVHNSQHLNIPLGDDLASAQSALDTAARDGNYQEVVLRESEMAMFSKQALVESRSTVQRIDNLYSWRDGLLRIDGETLGAFLDELQRYVTQYLAWSRAGFARRSDGKRSADYRYPQVKRI